MNAHVSAGATRGRGRWTVGDVASMAHVSVRALHHWGEIGLPVPSERSDAGYRLLSEADLERLHDLLLFRELGLSLEAIGHAVDDPTFDRGAALRAHRRRLEERVERTPSLLRAVDRAIDALEEGMRMASERMFEGFEDFDHAQYAEEARLFIDGKLHPCSHAMHLGPASLWESDERFRAYYEGLADFAVRAVRANAERAGVTRCDC